MSQLLWYGIHPRQASFQTVAVGTVQYSSLSASPFQVTCQFSGVYVLSISVLKCMGPWHFWPAAVSVCCLSDVSERMPTCSGCRSMAFCGIYDRVSLRKAAPASERSTAVGSSKQNCTVCGRGVSQDTGTVCGCQSSCS